MTNLTESQREIVLSWADDLLSGEFKQTSGALAENQNPGGEPEWAYCCLGVLSERAARQEEVRSKIDGYSDKVIRKVYGLEHEMSELPIEVQEWSGLEGSPYLKVPERLFHKLHVDGEVYHGSGWIRAIALNDVYDFTFAEIAECIQNTYGAA